MAKDKNGTPRHRLLNAWQPPRDAGAPIGVIATTFTLDTALFEEECLSRFLGVQSHPVRDGALYRIERDERLAHLKCAAVLADIHHCSGQRSLRWDLLAARPTRGVMHAKVSLLAWQGHVRFIVSSANLTPDGYRRNQECFAVLDFNDESSEAHLLDPLLKFISELLILSAGAARQRSLDLVAWVGQRLPRHEPRTRGLQRHVVLVGPDRPSLFKQVAEVLPRGTIDEAHVISPFFNPDLRQDGPEKTLWSLMRARGAAEVHYHVAGEPLSSGSGWRLQMPAHVLSATPRNRNGVGSFVHPIDVAKAPSDAGLERRPLHAKTLTLVGSNWIAALVGSSNFTSPGTAQPHASNREANVLYVIRGEAKELAPIRSRLLRGGPAIDPTTAIEFEPAFGDGDDEADTPCLPTFFETAELAATTDTGYELVLTFGDEHPEWPWAVHHDGVMLMHSTRWVEDCHPATITCRLPRTARSPSALQVTCSEHQYVVDWPVTYRSAQAIPPPDGVPPLTLAALMELLASGKPLHEALRDYMRSLPTDDDADVEAATELTDPHAKVDTSGFLMKRVQQACWAFVHLRRRLEEPITSLQTLDWRLNGPLGARAVLKAVEAQCDARLPDERAFLVCELAREMRAAKLTGPGGQTPPTEATSAFLAFVKELEAAGAEASRESTPAMQQYVREALEAQL